MLATLQKFAGADPLLIAIIKNASFSLAIDTVALQIADMGAKESGTCAARSCDMHFDNDAAHVLARQMPMARTTGSGRAARAITRACKGRLARGFGKSRSGLIQLA
ncbi:MAG: hypothetical protein VR75_01515 [Hyphomonadaceae bacterium BRH_c29]|nr:MAG: hypothetical protein VR75_01515 [Hyphomonadaceae bacterium BRH_c29]